MIKLLNKNSCSGCSACFSICPKHAIEMVPDDEGFNYPKIDSLLCIDCGLCNAVCPFLSDEASCRTSVLSVYAARKKDHSILDSSSSGGVFSLLSDEVLNQQGVVFGASFSQDFSQVNHISVRKKEDLLKIKTSKYVQSNISNAFIECKKELENGAFVLFSGTPCQIDGLKLFLGKEYSNLLCVEVVCHGVPSEKLWQKYLNHLISKNGHIISATFRSKKSGWENFGTNFVFEKKELFTVHQKDDYLIPFLKNMSLRPSCYCCKSKTRKSKADIILGDFWRINKVAPDFYDEKGVSMVIVNTDKGFDFINRIKEHIDCLEIDKNEIVEHKMAFSKSMGKPFGRDSFYSDVFKSSFKKINKKYFQPSLFLKIKNKLYSLTKKQKKQ